MPLQRINGEVVQENYGFAFPMRIVGSSRTVRVIVANEALVIEDRTAADDELQAELEDHMSSFESLAGEIFDLGRVTADGIVLITADDLVSAFG